MWAELHEQAFRRLGGATATVVLDNLREGVLKPDVYDAQLNPLYRDVLAHYGATALPCRVRDPDSKGKVESGVGHAQRTPLKGLRFETLDAAQRYLDDWEARWADTAAVTAMLDRLLHHAHLLECGPRSWRTNYRPTCRTDAVRATRAPSWSDRPDLSTGRI